MRPLPVAAGPEPVPIADRGLAQPPRTTSAELLRGGQELQIVHGELLYRLRLTALGKLILTK